MHDVESTEAAFAAAEGHEPSPEELEENIRERRRELLDHVRTLERIVRAKLDVRGRLRRARSHALLRIEAATERFAARVRERPLPYILAGVAVFALLMLRSRRA